MELNEALVKVDQTLENTTKKMEKIATEQDKQRKIFVEVDKKECMDRLDYFNILHSGSLGLPQDFHMGSKEVQFESHNG